MYQLYGGLQGLGSIRAMKRDARTDLILKRQEMRVFCETNSPFWAH